MKIRTDFVTNSSSSSFTMVLTVETESNVFEYEIYTEDQEGIAVNFVGSPKRMALAEDVESLIDMIQSAFEPMFDSEEDPSQEEIEDSVGGDALDELRELGSMDEIVSVAIRGDEGGWNNVDYWCEYKYDRRTGKYTCTEHGYPNGNGCSGSIDIPDYQEIDETIESDKKSRNVLLGF